jgi:beta-barrel assembly-enhancing protease
VTAKQARHDERVGITMRTTAVDTHMKTIPRVALVLLSVSLIGAQTVITPSKNNYTPAQDVELGRQAAAEVEQQLPILRDEEVTSSVASIGRRLVDVIPPEFRHSEFRYSFQVVNVREINAFALPGGPMYVNRGMIQRAHTEGEVAGVMAHELSHVALRHGTAQATKATKYELGTLAGAVLGAIIGGRVGGVVAQGTQFGLGTAFLRFSRAFEREADLLGSQIMAHAGYDPLDMANMFKTIEKESGPGVPQWLSDHPNPGDRYEAITREAKMLHVENPVRDSRAFEQMQARLGQMAPAPTTEEATRSTAGRGTSRSPDERPEPGPPASVAPPSSRTTTYTEGTLFRVSVPSNWRELPGSNAVTFAPEGGYGTAGGQSVVTHGVQIGVARNETHDVRTATDEFIDSLARGNPKLSRPSGYSQTSIGDRKGGLHTALSNVSDATGQQEHIEVFTILLRDSSLFYVLGVTPRERASAYQETFRRVVKSIRFVD